MDMEHDQSSPARIAGPPPQPDPMSSPAVHNAPGQPVASTAPVGNGDLSQYAGARTDHAAPGAAQQQSYTQFNVQHNHFQQTLESNNMELDPRVGLAQLADTALANQNAIAGLAQCITQMGSPF